MHGTARNNGQLDYSEAPNIFHRDVKDEYYAKVTEECKILGHLLDKELENLDDHGCHKIRDLIDPEIDEEN